MGNVFAFMAVVAVLGMRWPEALAFSALTKILPGGIGILWFVSRGDWRMVLRSLASIVVLSVISFVATPALWSEWVALLIRYGGNDLLSFRSVMYAMAIGVTVFAARMDKPSLLPVGMLLSVPTYVGNVKDLSVLTSAARLDTCRPHRPSDGPPAGRPPHVQHRGGQPAPPRQATGGG